MIYAPSDFSSVTIPADPQVGGCGQPHVRPAGPDGQPVQPWGLSCDAGCEDWLMAHDDRWVKDVLDVRPTFDEVKAADRWKIQGAREQDALMTSLLAQLAGYTPSQIPQSVQRAIGGIRPHVPLPGQLVCGQCTAAQPAGQPFCGQCGARMSAPAPAASITSGETA